MAPTFRAGKGPVTLVNNVNMSPILQDVAVEGSAKALDVTCHGNDDEVYIAGLRSGTATFEGLWDGTAVSTASTATTGALDHRFAAALGSTTQPVVTHGPEGGTAGQRVRMLRGESVKYAAMSPANDLVKVSADIQVSGRQDYGVWLHALTARSATSSTFASVDSGYDAGTTGGGVAHLHVTSASVAGLTVVVQHSSAESDSTASWADIITFSSVTESSASAAVQRSTVAGTVKRRTRAVITAFSTASGNSTSATFAVGFARRGLQR